MKQASNTRGAASRIESPSPSRAYLTAVTLAGLTILGPHAAT